MPLLFYLFVAASWFHGNIYSFTASQSPKHFSGFRIDPSLISGPLINRATRRNIKILFLLSLISLESVSEVYVRLPQDIVYGSSPSNLRIDKRANNDVVLIFPGAGGPDVHTEALKANIIRSDAKHRVQRFVDVYDWRKWEGSFVRAAFDAQAVGRKVCSSLAEEEKETFGTKPSNLHVIGISVGSFAADSCAKVFKRETNQQSMVRLTLLDPFTSKGIFGYGWGVNNFGKSADIVEDYLNTDDPVPTTNSPVLLAHTYDITSAASRNAFIPLETESMHSWPVAYLADHWETKVSSDGKLVYPSLEDEPPGVVEKIP